MSETNLVPDDACKFSQSAARAYLQGRLRGGMPPVKGAVLQENSASYENMRKRILVPFDPAKLSLSAARAYLQGHLKKACPPHRRCCFTGKQGFCENITNQNVFSRSYGSGANFHS